MGDKAIYSVDTVETITDNENIYVNTGGNIKQIKRSDLFIDINSNLGIYVKGTTQIYVPASGRNTFEFPNQNIKNISVVTKTETVIPYVLFANEKYYLCCHNLLNSENTIEVDYSYYTT